MKKLLLASLCFFSTLSPALADFSCKGKISYLAVGRNGTILVKGPGGLNYVYICNLQNKLNNVEVEACKGMYSTLLAAKSQDIEVNITFNNPDIESCSSIKSWSVAKNLNWIMTN